MTYHITRSGELTHNHWLLVLNHSLLCMPSLQKAFAQLMVTMKTTYKLSLRPESGTSYSTQNQTYNRSTLHLGGGRTQDHRLAHLFPLHHSMNRSRHMQKGPQLVSPFCIQSYVQPHSVQSCCTRMVVCVRIYNVPTRGYIDVTRWNHNRTQAIKVLTHSASGVCLYFG